MQHITTLFETPSVQIVNFDCSGICGEQEHIHEEISYEHEIVLPRYGVFQRYDAFGCQLVDVNYLAFFNRHQPHEISHPVAGADGCTIIRLSDGVLRDMVQSLDASVIERDNPFLAGGMLLDTMQQIGKHRLLLTLNQVDTYSEIAIEETVISFVADMITASYEMRLAPLPNHAHRETVHAIQVYLNSHYADNLALSDIAAQVHYSPYLLCRMFKQHIGLTMHQYLSRLRLFHALERLIAEPLMPVGDMALQLGFYSHSHFTAAFSQTFNLSPSDFRQQANVIQLADFRKNLKASLPTFPLH
jgi:AraC family transcriptional regulator